MATAPGPAPVPEFVSGEPMAFAHHALAVGSQIGGLQITGLIGEGGFGIVYGAYDPTLQRHVALKEYMPSQLAGRAAGGLEVTVRSPRHLETFNAGLRSFLNEARLLAQFDHPALVKVHQFWQANRTAYMVMPFYEGPTLKAHVKALAERGERLDEATLRRWLALLLDALELMHGEQCYHRDIAPDNILLTKNGPLLLDFGAARRVISDMTHALTVILKPGYAPIEQYSDVSAMAQGPWTDLYALASVVYFTITGSSPITSVERIMGDPLPRLAEVAAGRYSDTFLRAVDAALAVKPAERPQSVAEFSGMLDGLIPVPPAAPPAQPPPARQPPLPSRLPPPPAVAQASPPSPTFADTWQPPRSPPPPLPMPIAASRPQAGWAATALQAAATPGPRRMLILGGIAAAGLLGAFMWTTRSASKRELREEILPPAPPRRAAVPAPLPTPVPAPLPTPAVSPAPPGAAVAPAPPVAGPAPAAAPAAGPPVAGTAVPERAGVSGRPTSPATALPAPAAATPATTPVPAAVAPAPPAVAAPAAPAARPAPPAPRRPARCGELLEKGRQEPLALDEAEFLRRECT